MYINGNWITSNSEKKIYNPATEEIVDKVFIGGKSEAEQAVKSAKDAFDKWSKETPEVRASYLWKIAEEIRKEKEQFAQLISKEMGKTIHNARNEVLSTIGYFEWFAEEARRVYGDTISSTDQAKRMFTIKQPVGVVGAITPWNFPLSMIARKFAPALAAGCTIILKPALEAPLSAIKLFKVIEKVRLPKGIANLVLGPAAEIGAVFMESKAVRKITFTGSTDVGKLLMKQSANTVKKISMELGGHAPFIIFEDANIEDAVKGLVQSKFASTGQQCVSPNRVYVHESIMEEFTNELTEIVSSFKVGNGLDEHNDIGAMINEKGIEKVESHVKDALDKGAKLIYGGSRIGSEGCFYKPTILSEVTDEMIIVDEETFGPVIPLIPFSTEDGVLQKANSTNYGLASYFYTNDIGRMYRMSERLEFGMIGVNDSSPFNVKTPFGGVKESGIGKEGGYQGLEEYLETKSVSVKITPNVN